MSILWKESVESTENLLKVEGKLFHPSSKAPSSKSELFDKSLLLARFGMGRIFEFESTFFGGATAFFGAGGAFLNGVLFAFFGTGGAFANFDTGGLGAGGFRVCFGGGGFAS